ncbi:MAG: hypothetical protein LBU36_00460 [Clostridiales bacterium]|jgi:hypothetical protein|nr:hypothetical protein [Clostridiales bacterium]
MLYIKVTISEILGERNTSFFIKPKPDELDEYGLPVFNEAAVKQLKIVRKFARKVKNHVVHLRYSVRKSEGGKNLYSWAEFCAADERGDRRVKVLCENDYLLDLKKKFKFYYEGI